MYPVSGSADGRSLTGTRVTLIKSGTNGSFRSNRIISCIYQVLRTQLKSLICKGFCGTKPSRLDDFLVPDVSVKHFLRLLSLKELNCLYLSIVSVRFGERLGRVGRRVR